jgi:hypothetical protein
MGWRSYLGGAHGTTALGDVLCQPRFPGKGFQGGSKAGQIKTHYPNLSIILSIQIRIDLVHVYIGAD